MQISLIYYYKFKNKIFSKLNQQNNTTLFREQKILIVCELYLQNSQIENNLANQQIWKIKYNKIVIGHTNHNKSHKVSKSMQQFVLYKDI